MKTSIISSLLALLLSLAGTQAGVFDFMENLPSATEIYKQKQCSNEVRSVSSCNLAPFTGVFVCREIFTFLLWESKHTVCAANVAENITLALEGDECGCCEGECPQECPCECGKADEDGVFPSVMVQMVLLGNTKGPSICVPKGVARHATAWGGRVVCSEVCFSETEESFATSAPTEGF